MKIIEHTNKVIVQATRSVSLATTIVLLARLIVVLNLLLGERLYAFFFYVKSSSPPPLHFFFFSYFVRLSERCYHTNASGKTEKCGAPLPRRT